MTWFKIDGRFAMSPEAVTAGGEALGLWAVCGSWSAAHLTDGFVMSEVAHSYAPPAVAKRLVDVGLWDEVPGGYQFSTSGRIVYWEIERESQYRRKIPQSIRASVLERDGHTCQHCGATGSLTMDHIHPWSRGGRDTMDNLQTLCMPCNRAKGATV